MTEKDLQYVIDVLKGTEPTRAPEDWYGILGFLQCHRIAGLFYCYAEKLEIPLPQKIDSLLRQAYEKQKRRVLFMRAYIAELSEELSFVKADYVFLKGSILANLTTHAIYNEGERFSNDIDLLVKPDGLDKVEKALRNLGYVQGKYNAENNTVIPYTRLEIVKRRMNRGEAAPFIKLTGFTEIPFIEVDINFSLGNTPSEGLELLAEMVDSGREYSGKVSIRVPSAELFFLHLIMHQYKESCLYFMTVRSKDLDLYKLADIYYIVQSGVIDINKVFALAEQYKIKDKLGAVLQQIGEIFSDEDILSFSEQLGAKQPDILDYEGRKRYEWRLPIRERLCSFNSLKYLFAKGNL